MPRSFPGQDWVLGISDVTVPPGSALRDRTDDGCQLTAPAAAGNGDGGMFEGILAVNGEECRSSRHRGVVDECIRAVVEE